MSSSNNQATHYGTVKPDPPILGFLPPLPGAQDAIDPRRFLNATPFEAKEASRQASLSPLSALLWSKPLAPQPQQPVFESTSRRIHHGPPSINKDVQTWLVSGAPKPEPIELRDGQERLLRDPMPRKERRSKKRGQESAEVSREPTEPINPQDYYGQPQKSPEPWGWKNDKGECTFRYNKLGEFVHDSAFSRTELEAYFYAQAPQRTSSKHSHAKDAWVDRELLPGEREVVGKQRRGLTLWIGWSPAQASHRYPSDSSNLCRFKDCLMYRRRFKGGHPRVTFDERMNVDGAVRDPYHVAGYMHLFCLEQQFDILKLIEDLDVRLDTRSFIKEDNLGSFCMRQRPRDQIKAAHDWLEREWSRKEVWDDYLRQLRQERDGLGLTLLREQTARPRNFNDSLTKNMVETDIKYYSVSGTRSRIVRQREAEAQGRVVADAMTALGNLEFVRDEMDSRSARGHGPRQKPKKDLSLRRDDTGLKHRVYELEHFTEGFSPGEEGPSNCDALGWPGRGFRPPRRQSQPARMQAPMPVHHFQPPFLSDPLFLQGSNLPGGIHTTSGQGQAVFDPNLSSVPSMVEPEYKIPTDFTDFGLAAAAGFTAPVSMVGANPLGTDHVHSALGRKNISVDPPLPKRQRTGNSPADIPASGGSTRMIPRGATSMGPSHSPQYIVRQTPLGPVVYVHRGESPVRFDVNYKTLTNKRKRDNELPQDDQGGSTYPPAPELVRFDPDYGTVNSELNSELLKFGPDYSIIDGLPSGYENTASKIFNEEMKGHTDVSQGQNQADGSNFVHSVGHEDLNGILISMPEWPQPTTSGFPYTIAEEKDDFPPAIPPGSLFDSFLSTDTYGNEAFDLDFLADVDFSLQKSIMEQQTAVEAQANPGPQGDLNSQSRSKEPTGRSPLTSPFQPLFDASIGAEVTKQAADDENIR
ncbi:hypothetical protein SCAR479_01687 [Seiridium cardinale]|uniref:Uncharacterized protein n=1 Tax=Seiridium cardinale TaxID=138064 RepID=A0ABR2Y657_9PEZI